MSSRFEDTIRLAEDRFRIRRVMDHSPRIDGIESGIRVGKSLTVTDEQLRRKAQLLEPRAHVPDGPLGQIHPVEVGAGLGVALMIGPEPDSELQHPLATALREFGQVLDVWLESVALFQLVLVVGSLVPAKI